MGSILVIVAIPDANDPVWKVSSEKIPHLTLLLLGDVDRVDNLDQIALFVEHAATTTLKRFYLNVDRRGELGDDKADVLFFQKRGYDCKAICDFRSALLKDNNIKTAYDSTTQFEGPWQPHLTLGYPSDPAKSDQDYEFYGVGFNRIAVWVGDFEGPEFLLKDYWDEFDELETMANVLHFGTKGMKWGVRKTNRQFAKSQQLLSEAQALKAESPRKAAKKLGQSGDLRYEVVNKVMAQTSKAAKKDLADLRKRPEFKDINFREGGKAKFDLEKFRALDKAEADIWTSHLNKTVEGYKFDVKVSKGTWDLIPQKIKHADESVLKVRPIRDADGYIIDVELIPQEDSMTQTVELGEEFLEHFGVQGMHWGVRKAKAGARAAGRGAKAVGRGLAAMGANLADSSWQDSTYSDTKHEEVHNHVAQRLDSRIDKLQRSPKYRGKDLKANSDLRKEYYQDVAKVSTSAYRQGVREVYGENYTGTKTAHYVTDARGPRIEVRNKRTGDVESEAPLTSKAEIARRRRDESLARDFGTTARHADTPDFPDITIELKVDENDQITGVGFIKPAEAAIAQTIDLGSEYILEHHGVKGQKWGVRREETGSGGHIRISEKTNRASASKETMTGIVALALIMPPLLPVAFLSPRVRAEVKAARSHNQKAQADDKWFKEIDRSKKGAEVHNTAANEINSKLPGFNSDKRWKEADGKDIHLPSNPVKQKEYDRALEDEVVNPAYARAAVQVYGSKSPSDRYVFEIHDHSTGTVKVRDTLAEKRVKHAADDVISVKFSIVRDDDGHILGFEPDADDVAEHDAFDLGFEFVLEHFGTKGMKWGVRKTASGAKKTSTFVKDLNFERRTEADTGRHSKATKKVAKAAQKPFKKEDLPAVKARHGDYGKLTNRAQKPLSKEARAYRKDARETYIKRLETTANSMVNASGTRQYTVRERGIDLPAEGGNLPKSKYRWEVSSRNVKHAASDADILLDLVMEDGYIVDLLPVEDTLTQSVDFGAVLISDFMDADLEHFGVRGMHWGQRKTRPSPVAKTPTATSVVPHGTKRKTKIDVDGGENHPAHEDAIKVAQARVKLKKSGTAALSNQELRDLANRIQLENQVAILTSSKGKKFVSQQFDVESQRLAKKGAKAGVKAATPHVTKKLKKTAATVAVTALL